MPLWTGVRVAMEGSVKSRGRGLRLESLWPFEFVDSGVWSLLAHYEVVYHSVSGTSVPEESQSGRVDRAVGRTET